jgi:hypothetical protein
MIIKSWTQMQAGYVACMEKIRNACETSGSHAGEYEDDRFLGYSAV